MRFHTSKWQSLGIIVCLSGVLTAHVFGQQPAILIANSNTGTIARYNGLTGEYEGLFVSPGSGNKVEILCALLPLKLTYASVETDLRTSQD